jgi:hypothetical protein
MGVTRGSGRDLGFAAPASGFPHSPQNLMPLGFSKLQARQHIDAPRLGRHRWIRSLLGFKQEERWRLEIGGERGDLLLDRGESVAHRCDVSAPDLIAASHRSRSASVHAKG